MFKPHRPSSGPMRFCILEPAMHEPRCRHWPRRTWPRADCPLSSVKVFGCQPSQVTRRAWAEAGEGARNRDRGHVCNTLQPSGCNCLCKPVANSQASVRPHVTERNARNDPASAPPGMMQHRRKAFPHVHDPQCPHPAARCAAEQRRTDVLRRCLHRTRDRRDFARWMEHSRNAGLGRA